MLGRQKFKLLRFKGTLPVRLRKMAGGVGNGVVVKKYDLTQAEARVPFIYLDASCLFTVRSQAFEPVAQWCFQC